jgi:integrase
MVHNSSVLHPEVEGAEPHRFRKTYVDTLHEEGVSVNTIRIRLGRESLDVTQAYLKGKDAESEEPREHANSGSLDDGPIIRPRESAFPT